MGKIDLPWKTLYTLIKLIMCQTNIGNYMYFEAIDKKGKVYKEKIVNTDGIITPLIMSIHRPIIKPITIFSDDGYHKLNCAICFDSGDESGPDNVEKVTAFSNFCPTIDMSSTHITGTIEGITRWFSKYMNSVYLANQNKKSKLNVLPTDIKTGLNIMISAAHLNPEFTGQAKERLSNDDMKVFCKDTVMNGLEEWSKVNPQDLTKLCKFFKEIAEIRSKTDKEKVKVANKFGSNPLNGLPAKYVRPIGRKNIELVIVEGDSAKGSAVNGRDPMTQGKLYAPYFSNEVCVNF
jgi:DNA gyrase/topoisomerase IV subunit B